MTLITTIVTETQVSNGGVTYSYGMEYLPNTAMTVFQVFVAGVEMTTGYNIVEPPVPTNGNIKQGFEITFDVAPNGEIQIDRHTDRLQSTDYGDTNAYHSQSHEDRTDKTMMVSQEIDYANNNPSAINLPTGYPPPELNKYARWESVGIDPLDPGVPPVPTALVDDTAPAQYADGSWYERGDSMIKGLDTDEDPVQFWVCLGANDPDPNNEFLPIFSTYNSFEAEINNGWWTAVVGQTGNVGTQGPQGVNGQQGIQGEPGESGSEWYEQEILNNQILPVPLDLHAGVEGETTIQIQAEISRSDGVELRRDYSEYVVILFDNVWTVTRTQYTLVGGNPDGFTLQIDGATGDLFYVSDDMTGGTFDPALNNMKLYVWRFRDPANMP